MGRTMAKGPRKMRIATIWEVVEGEMKGRYIIEPHTGERIWDVLTRIIWASNAMLRTVLKGIDEEYFDRPPEQT